MRKKKKRVRETKEWEWKKERKKKWERKNEFERKKERKSESERKKERKSEREERKRERAENSYEEKTFEFLWIPDMSPAGVVPVCLQM